VKEMLDVLKSDDYILVERSVRTFLINPSACSLLLNSQLNGLGRI